MSEKEYRIQLKRIFTGYRRFTPQVERALMELGITVGRQRNHIILFVQSRENRRSISISSTGSDKRAGLNIVSNIMKTLETM